MQECENPAGCGGQFGLYNAAADLMHVRSNPGGWMTAETYSSLVLEGPLNEILQAREPDTKAMFMDDAAPVHGGEDKSSDGDTVGLLPNDKNHEE